VRALVVVDAGEGIEARLLLQKFFPAGWWLPSSRSDAYVRACRSARGCRFDALDGDPRRSHHTDSLLKPEEGAVAGEAHRVAADGARQP